MSGPNAPAFAREEVNEILGSEDPIPSEGAPAPAVAPSASPAPAVAAPAAPAAEPAAAQPVTDDGSAAVPAADAGTTPAGEGGVEPPAAAAVPTEAEIRAGVYKDVVDRLLAGKPAPASPPPPLPPEPPHIRQAREVAALSEEKFDQFYEGLVEKKQYRRAEELAAFRANAPGMIWQYEQIREIRAQNEEALRRHEGAESNAFVAELDRNPNTKDWKQYRKTMARLADRDDPADPVYADPESLYLAARALDTRGKSPPLAPTTAAAKAALSSGAPAPRGGPAAPGKAPEKPKRDPFIAEVFAPDASPFDTLK